MYKIVYGRFLLDNFLAWCDTLNLQSNREIITRRFSTIPLPWQPQENLIRKVDNKHSEVSMKQWLVEKGNKKVKIKQFKSWSRVVCNLSVFSPTLTQTQTLQFTNKHTLFFICFC